MGRGRGGKERETKNKRRKTKGQWESILPHPSLPELWGCRGDCLQGSGPRGQDGARARGPAQGLPFCPRGAVVRGSALVGACRLGGASSVSCHSHLGQAVGRTRGRAPSFPSLPAACFYQHGEGSRIQELQPFTSSWRETEALRGTEPCP